jgi:KaiC/GvpD/RAD55 family RecA-like ATPase
MSDELLSDEEKADLERVRLAIAEGARLAAEKAEREDRFIEAADRIIFAAEYMEAGRSDLLPPKANGERSAKPNGQAAKGAAPQKPSMVIEWFGEAADSALSDPANQLIEGVLDEGGLSVIYGDSGSGKTFAALDMAFHVGASLDWNGKKVRRGLVVYVAAEGGRRIKRRIAALQKRYREEYGDVAPDPLFALVRYPIDLRSSDADLNSLLALVRDAEKKTGEKCVWLIVDTLSRAMAGGDENSPVDMGRIVAAADRFRAMTGAHFTYVHHTGKDAARGARGHSLLRAATDTEIETTAGSLTLTKQRDGELGFKIGFRLVDLVIGDDAAGNCVKSAVVEWSAAQAPKTKTKLEPAPSRRLLMSVVDQALGECGFQFTPWADGPAVCCAKDSIVRDRYFARIAEPEDDADMGKAHERKRKAWFRSVKAALDAKALLAAPYEGDRVLWKP